MNSQSPTQRKPVPSFVKNASFSFHLSSCTVQLRKGGRFQQKTSLLLLSELARRAFFRHFSLFSLQAGLCSFLPSFFCFFLCFASRFLRPLRLLLLVDAAAASSAEDSPGFSLFTYLLFLLLLATRCLISCFPVAAARGGGGGGGRGLQTSSFLLL